MSTESADPLRPVGLLRRHRDFRLLWLGETTGKFGSSVTGLAMPLIAITTLHASTFQVSLLSAAGWLPWLLIGLPVGVWVDRMRCRSIMLTTSAVSLVLLLGVPIAARAGILTMSQLLGVALAIGAAGVFFQTAYTAYLPGLLEPADRAEGNAKLHGSASAAQIVGLGSGGAIAQLLGPVNGLLVDAATFLISLCATARIRYREPVRKAAPRQALFREVGDGLRLMTGNAWFRTLTLFGACSNLALTGYQSILAVFLVREVGLDSGVVGALIAAASTGGIVGAALARRVGARIGTARTMLLFEGGLTLPALLIPLTGRGAGLALYVLGGFAVSLGVVGGNVLKSTFQQHHCPPELLSRLSASSSVLNYGTIPVGALAGGLLATELGLRPAMWILTAGVPLAALILWFSPVRHCRDLPTEPMTAREASTAAEDAAAALG
ncbi:MFS transporter [Kitasatospora sp. NPDC001175]|uniref:MFS transporter n=1 Tax=Kitasatospora sp. NPDC001175 TaxID=3157103 RepID=UPI003D035394